MTKMQNRFNKLRAKMAELGLDAIYVNSAENHLYMSDFDNPDGWIFITKENAYLYADSRYIEAARAEATELCTVCLPGQPTLQEVARDNGVKVIGYEDRRLTCSALEGLKRNFDGMGIEFAPLGGLFTDLRCYKTEDEV